MLGNGHEQVVEQFQTHRISSLIGAARGDTGPPGAAGIPAQQKTAGRVHLRIPAGLDDSRGDGLADHCGTWNAIIRSQRVAVIHGSLVSRAPAPQCDDGKRYAHGSGAPLQRWHAHGLAHAQCLNDEAFDHDCPLGRRKSEMCAMRHIERLPHLLQRS